ncbi:hypothetical protein K469DRAFT_721223 [Zopfia rhizophila CBS 207.26]|uniref:Uncharacterized protein n=1 Tax=Zopfia rhizophila CBS 207.26 TaxID=1314779 RepID=A0A6A6EH11_9PEZI|nr:hypothetical protein K469DRAFT_721223 [Zopfia rhizophila CBS 207.26]
MAQSQLAELLLVRPDEGRNQIVPQFKLNALKDSPAIKKAGWCFITDERRARGKRVGGRAREKGA